MINFQSKPETASKQDVSLLTRLFGFSKSASFPTLSKYQKDSSCSGRQMIIMGRRNHFYDGKITKEEAQKRLYSWKRMTRSRTSFL